MDRPQNATPNPMKRNRRERRLAWFIFLLMVALALAPGWLRNTPAAAPPARETPQSVAAP